MDEKTKISARTVQWKSGDRAHMRCAHCGVEFPMEQLNPAAMRCPECGHQEWVMEGPASGERTQIPSAP